MARSTEVDIARLDTPDAEVWAEEFAKAFKVSRRPSDAPVDDVEGLMVGWFANAMVVQERATNERWEARVREATEPGFPFRGE